jgi:isoquinoline 1-oxidoreductase beta subunit
VHESFNTFVAQVAEVTVKADGSFKLDRVVCAVDCGIAVNPDVIRRADGRRHRLWTVGRALRGDYLEGRPGRAVELSRLPGTAHEMPAIEVYIVNSSEKPSGVGEPGTPVIAPALANALFAATGKRVRSLPIRIDSSVKESGA